MPRTIALAILGLSAAAAAGAGPPGAESPRATSLRVAESSFRDPEIVVEKSLPPRFELRLPREMPTPGWRFEIDALDSDPGARRIEARVTALGPQGIVTQVLTDATLALPLGTLEPGTWVLEIRLRRGTDQAYQPVAVFLLQAGR